MFRGKKNVSEGIVSFYLIENFPSIECSPNLGKILIKMPNFLHNSREKKVFEKNGFKK